MQVKSGSMEAKSGSAQVKLRSSPIKSGSSQKEVFFWLSKAQPSSMQSGIKYGQVRILLGGVKIRSSRVKIKSGSSQVKSAGFFLLKYMSTLQIS